ncbi:MAG: IclR family transcriptional regulator [Candidatus Limnocylindrales bacterium]
MPIIGTPTGSLTLQRAIAVLDVLRAADGSVGAAEVSRRVGLSRSAVHRLLSTLAAHGLVEQDEESRAYRLGWALLRYSDALLHQTRVADVAPVIARRLRDATKETVTVQVRSGSDRVVVYEAEGPQEVHRRVGIGTRLPLHAGASGLAILAYLPQPELARLLVASTDPLTPHTVTDPARLAARLADIRASGVAHSESETVLGASAVAAPVWMSSGEVVGSIAVSGPTWRWAEVQLIAEPLVRAAAAELSTRLGFTEQAREVAAR